MLRSSSARIARNSGSLAALFSSPALTEFFALAEEDAPEFFAAELCAQPESPASNTIATAGKNFFIAAPARLSGCRSAPAEVAAEAATRDLASCAAPQFH